jgi:hypothetical protein
MAPWIFEPFVQPATPAPPSAGRLYWGENVRPAFTAPRYVDYLPEMEQSVSLEACIDFAARVLRETNALAQQAKPDAAWDSRTRERYESGRQVRRAIAGNEATPLEFAYWTYDTTPADAPFGSACRVEWSSTGTAAAPADSRASVAGAVSRQHNGKMTQCMYPRHSPNCMQPKFSGGIDATPGVCSGLALRDGLGDACRAWYDALPALAGEANQTTVTNQVCPRASWNLAECVCMDRVYDEAYKAAAERGLNGGQPDVCWWMPCKIEDAAVRVLPAMAAARAGSGACALTFCGNLLQTGGENNNFLEKVQNNVSCTSTTTNNTGGGGDAGGTAPPATTAAATVAPLTVADAVQQAAQDAATSSSTMTYVIVGAVALLLFVLALLAYALFGGSAAPAAAPAAA